MISKELVGQIEDHSGRLTQEVLAAVRNDIRTKSYHRLPETALREAVEALFRHLGHWLTSRTDYAVERRYQRIGRERYVQGVELSQLVFAFSLVRETLIRFLRSSAIGDAADRQAEYDLALAICDFTERAVYYAARGYEDACRAEELAAAKGKAKAKTAAKPKGKPKPLPEKAWDPAEEWHPDISRGGDVGEVSG